MGDARIPAACDQRLSKLICRRFLVRFVGFDASVLVFLVCLLICRLHVAPKYD